MSSFLGAVVAALVGALLAVGVSTAIVATQHPDAKVSTTSGVGPNDTSDQSVLDYGTR